MFMPNSNRKPGLSGYLTKTWPGWFVRIGNKKDFEMIFIQYDKENTEKFLRALNNLFVKKK